MFDNTLGTLPSWIQRLNQIFHSPPYIVLSVEDGRREKKTTVYAAVWCIRKCIRTAVYLDKSDVELPVKKGLQP